MSFASLEIDLGDSAKLPVQLTVAGVLTDPTTLALELKSPAGVVTTDTYPTNRTGLTWTKNATGDYQAVITAAILSTAGLWYYSYISTGTAAGAEQGQITVNARSST